MAFNLVNYLKEKIKQFQKKIENHHFSINISMYIFEHIMLFT